MGASGDMLMAALYEALPDKGAFRKKMEQLKLPGVTLEYTESKKCGITGTRIIVKVGGAEEKCDDEHHHHHDEYGYKEILDLIREMDLPDKVKDDALGVYRIIGEAEAKVHGVPVEKVHLHEIGALDAVTDIVGCSLLVEMLGVKTIFASPVHLGSGHVRCDHGILPVPAPATAEILKGVPVYGGGIEGELCTPTGAALLKRFVTHFCEMPPMKVAGIGYGMGAKDFPAANCLRAFLFEDDGQGSGSREIVYEISCNLDDMTPEAVGAAYEVLIENGALDVYTTPIIMKKNRPAVMLSCLCVKDKLDELSRLMLKHTSTLGVRITECRRDVLTRTIETVCTGYGEIRIKQAQGFGTMKYKPEYDDVIAASKNHGVAFQTVHDAALRVAAQGEKI